jgi:ABC-type nickel/cobalt efflux system permease component RcnA
MKRRHLAGFLLGTGLLAAAVLCAPAAGHAHPMGNFSISHYAAIRVLATSIEVRYVLDLAEIPTFQEIQDSGIVAETGHASLGPYLARKAEALGSGLVLELNGRRLTLERGTREILFTRGAGDLPTMKLGVVYRAALDARAVQPQNHLVYRDGNYPERAGWKEVIAGTGPRVAVLEASVPERDRSRALADYPTDLLNSPPQDLEAAVTFTVAPLLPIRDAAGPAATPPANRERHALESVTLPPRAASASPAAASAETPPSSERPLRLEPNRRATPRDAFTALIATPEISASILVIAALLAAALGAFHALEPGHGKTVVAAYLVGSRGTARHALILGLIVTASHTAGVYVLGGVTLYASRYIVPERLYPWLGAVSGLIIATLGFALFLRRYAGRDEHHGHEHHGHGHDHDHAHGRHHHGHRHGDGHEPGHDHGHGHGHHHHLPAGQSVSLRELFALGITGGIVPCPAALVVLLSAVALRRVGFGLFLIAAFSVGLAAVLIAIGLLMVYARRLMARFQGEGRMVTRWLPLTSSAVMTVLGLAIAGQALMAAGILQLRLG